MVWGAIAAIGGSVIGGLLSSSAQRSAASKASAAELEAAKLGIGFQEKQLAEQQYQFDVQMDEYRRKQELLEQNYEQMQQYLQPYIQSGQGALYEQMALSGIAAPGSPIQTTQKTNLQIQPVRGPTIIGRPQGQIGIPTGEASAAFRPPMPAPGSSQISATGGGGAIQQRVNIPGAKTDPKTGQRYFLDESGVRINIQEPTGVGNIGAPMGGVFNAVNEALKQPVQDVRDVYKAAAEKEAWQAQPNVVNPYAGMTGEQAQAAAIERISSSPLLQELMSQGEQGILQQAAATGGLRGGNVQAALAQFRPQMLQQEIERQYARLGGLAGTGQQSILQTPTVSPGAMPSYPGMDTSIAQLMMQMGESQAQKALAYGKAQGDLWSGIGSSIGRIYGYGAGKE